MPFYIGITSAFGCPIVTFVGTHLANAFDIYTTDTIIKLNEHKKKKAEVKWKMWVYIEWIYKIMLSILSSSFFVLIYGKFRYIGRHIELRM